MKRVTLVVLTLALIAIPLSAKESSEAALRATYDAFVAAWNSHDAKAMAAAWANDGDLVNPFGRAARGREAIETMMQDEHSKALRQSTYKPGPLSIRFLEPEIAVVESDDEITGMTAADGTAVPAMHIHAVRVMQKKAGKWLAVVARPMIYPPAPGPR
ncbi:MAG: hypothetical protein NVSMB68_04910 [Thermoanaerobaculia bacterium]